MSSTFQQWSSMAIETTGNFKTFFSIMVYYKIVSTVLYAIQWDLVVCPFFMKQLTSASPNFTLHPSANPLPAGNHESVLYR